MRALPHGTGSRHRARSTGWAGSAFVRQRRNETGRRDVPALPVWNHTCIRWAGEDRSGPSGRTAGSAQQAQAISEPTRLFQDMVDRLFADTGKTIIRTENEICFTQIGETLQPYKLSSGEKQLLVILLTVLVEDKQPYILFMDEPEVRMHIEWQKQLIDLILTLNPNVQIILTTHSPAVIMNGWMENVTEVSDITMNE